MPMQLRQFNIYSLSTFKAFSEAENNLYYNEEYKKGNAEYRSYLSDSLDDSKRVTIKETRREGESSIFSLVPMADDESQQRTIAPSSLNNNNLIPVFENEVIRFLIDSYPDHVTTIAGEQKLLKGLVFMEVRHNDILRNIINNDIMIDGVAYSFYTSGASAQRKNQIALVESSILEAFKSIHACGLTDKIINDKGGMNTGKYLAYSALPLSSSKPIEIDINKVIVVPDLEIFVDKEVERIDSETFESKITTLKTENIPLCQTDGVGMILPVALREVQSQLELDYDISGFQLRAPWVKGLLVPFDFHSFALACGNSTVTDVYGKPHDILAEDVQVIITDSQFKARKLYDSWEQYKDHFIANGLSLCAAATSNPPKEETEAAYQFLQTLDRDKATPEAIAALCKKSTDLLINLRSDTTTVLTAFGAVEENPNKEPVQEATMLYPSLLCDNGIIREISTIVCNRRNNFKEGDLLVGGHYGYFMPDLYAFCEYLFEGKSNPLGIIRHDEVYCHYHQGRTDIKMVDCLRSPHLGNEHNVRQLSQSADCAKWFKYCGQNVITSVQDCLSLGVQGDYDGDTIFLTHEAAILNMIAPHNVLSYAMEKAEPQEVNSHNLYETLVNSFKCNNIKSGLTIGVISNAITKIWNAEEVTASNIQLSKYLVMLNNYIIDYPKTQKHLPITEDIRARYDALRAQKNPCFFKWAKKKKKVNDSNKSIMSKIVAEIDKVTDTNYSYFEGLPEFEYSMLQGRAGGKIYGVDRNSLEYKSIHSTCKQLGPKARQIQIKAKKRKDVDKKIHHELRDALYLSELMGLCGYDKEKLCNILVDIYYNQPDIPSMFRIMWNCVGDVIVRNICANLSDSSYKPMERPRKAYEKIAPIVQEIKEDIENAKPIIYKHELEYIRGIDGARVKKPTSKKTYRKGADPERVQKIYFALLIKAKQ